MQHTPVFKPQSKMYVSRRLEKNALETGRISFPSLLSSTFKCEIKAGGIVRTVFVR